jgi:hypothetical protein
MYDDELESQPPPTPIKKGGGGRKKENYVEKKLAFCLSVNEWEIKKKNIL